MGETHGYHQIVIMEIRLIIFFAAKDGEAIYSQQKQEWYLKVGVKKGSQIWIRFAKGFLVILLNLSASGFLHRSNENNDKIHRCYREKPEAHKGSTSQKDIRPRLNGSLICSFNLP